MMLVLLSLLGYTATSKKPLAHQNHAQARKPQIKLVATVQNELNQLINSMHMED